MLPSLKITLAAMAVTVVVILAVLAGFGAHRGSAVPILSAAAVPRVSAPLTLVDNPQEEERMRQRVARRSDEVTRLLALPHGPVFALGSDATDAPETGSLLFAPPAPRSIVARPSAPDLPVLSAPAATAAETDRIAGLPAGPQNNAERTAPADTPPREGPLTPISRDAYARALRAATAKPEAQLAAVGRSAPAETASDMVANAPSASIEPSQPKLAGIVPLPPLRAAAVPQPRPKPASLIAGATAKASLKAEQEERAEKGNAEKLKRARRAAANRKKLLARRARAAAAAAVKPAPAQTNWFGQPVVPNQQ